MCHARNGLSNKAFETEVRGVLSNNPFGTEIIGCYYDVNGHFKNPDFVRRISRAV